MVSRSELRRLLLNLSYEDLAESCQRNADSAEICSDPAFWEAKAERDFGKSLREVTVKGSLPAEEKYLALLAENGVAFGAERYKDPQVLAHRAAQMGREEYLQYLVEEDYLDLVVALSEATVNTNMFYGLLERFGFIENNLNLLDQYPEIFYPVYLAAIQNNNFDLVEDLTLAASQIFNQINQQKEILAAAASTGNYNLILYLLDYFTLPLEDYSANSWLLQAALLNQDDPYVQDLIDEFLNQEDYIELAVTLVRAGSYQRLVTLVEFLREKLDQGEISESVFTEMARQVLTEAVRYNRLSFVKLIRDNPAFAEYYRRSWFEEALDLAKKLNHFEIVTYLQSLLRQI